MAKEFLRIAQSAINNRIQQGKKVAVASCGVDTVGGSLYLWIQHENISTHKINVDMDLILDEKSVDNYLDVLINDFKGLVAREMGL